MIYDLKKCENKIFTQNYNYNFKFRILEIMYKFSS